jgi:uncharacterized protein YndB with AHSA1/START domain
MTSSTDRIEKELFVRAPRDRVWRAISNAGEFGDWFGMELDGEFAPGARMAGRIKPTKADAAVAEIQKKYTGMHLEFVVERLEPMSVFSYRWHPFAVDPGADYSKEPMTLVTFKLEPADGGTIVRIIESGFDSIPIERRAEAFEANDEGWAMQLRLIEKYLLLPQP